MLPFVKKKLEVKDKTRIRPIKNFNSFLVEAGNVDKLSFLEKDRRNYIEKVRRLKFGVGDASAIQKYFCKCKMRIQISST